MTLCFLPLPLTAEMEPTSLLACSLLLTQLVLSTASWLISLLYHSPVFLIGSSRAHLQKHAARHLQHRRPSLFPTILFPILYASLSKQAVTLSTSSLLNRILPNSAGMVSLYALPPHRDSYPGCVSKEVMPYHRKSPRFDCIEFIFHFWSTLHLPNLSILSLILSIRT